jgi:hypothetical protein
MTPEDRMRELRAARDVAVAAYRGCGLPAHARAVAAGHGDHLPAVQAALLAFRRAAKDRLAQDAADNAAKFCIEHLAEMLGNPDYVAADGSEEWEGDVAGTINNVLIAARVLDPWDWKVAQHEKLHEEEAAPNPPSKRVVGGADSRFRFKIRDEAKL